MKTKGKSVESFVKERKEPKERNACWVSPNIKYKFVKISKERSERNFFDKGIRNFFNIQMFPMENK